MKYNFPKIPFFLSLLLLGLSCLGFFTLYAKIKNNNLIEEQIFAEWQVEDSKREEIKTLNRFLYNTEQDRKSLDSHFAQSSNVVPFLDMLEKLASQVGSKAEVLLVNMPDDNSGLDVEVKISGGFESMYKFITLLENSPYEIEITSFNMTKTFFDTANKQSYSGWLANFKIKLLSFLK